MEAQEGKKWILLSRSFSTGSKMECMRNEKLKVKKRKSLDVLALLGPLTTRPSIASLSDVINIDVVIKQLSGNEGG